MFGWGRGGVFGVRFLAPPSQDLKPPANAARLSECQVSLKCNDLGNTYLTHILFARNQAGDGHQR